jgi:hypothetical protein
MKVNPSKLTHQNAIYCDRAKGPTFGGGHDIRISDNANITRSNYSRLGHTYKHPQYDIGKNEAETFLAGSYQFQLDEIEVYEKRMKTF